MYGIGIVFLLYFYLFLLHPSWYNFILNKCQKKKWFKDSKPLIGANHTGDGAGSLYLRLGTFLGPLEWFCWVWKGFFAYRMQIVTITQLSILFLL
uniref:ATP synthase F0 subunit 8 n=1 Tax=Panagrolaimus sp. JU765 TaxID=591449 RepID=A0AC34Q3E8_9BILA